MRQDIKSSTMNSQDLSLRSKNMFNLVKGLAPSPCTHVNGIPSQPKLRTGTNGQRHSNQEPDYQPQETDIILCGNSIGNLFRFA
jgi:hypothetical protein